MRAVRCADAAEFLDRAGEFLLRDELRNNILLGLATLVAHDRARYDALYEGPPFFAVVTEGARVISAAIRTPPFGVGTAATDAPTAVAALAPLLHEEYRTLPGVNGTRDDAAAFATAWERLAGQAAHLRHAGDARGLRPGDPQRHRDRAGVDAPGAAPAGLRHGGDRCDYPRAPRGRARIRLSVHRRRESHQAIGYRPVCDAEQWAFAEPAISPR